MYIVLKFIGLLVLLFLVPTDFIAAQVKQASNSGLPIPRFVSLRSDKVHMRTGPGVRYPIDWVYIRRNMPMEIVNEFDTWRKVRDYQGTEGWMHKSMLSSQRSLAVTGQTRTLRYSADSGSSAVARIEPGTIGQIIQCKSNSGWCFLSFGKYEGWLRRVEIWGVYSDEKIK